jgi:hypothetical protein
MTRRKFSAPASWQTFDLDLAAPQRTFAGAVSAGRFVYFIPAHTSGAAAAPASGLVVRYDTAMPFGERTSFASFDATAIHVGARGYYGGTFDGRYVYFVPNAREAFGGSATAAHHGLVLRFDTTGEFQAAASWSSFDTTSLDPEARHFTGAVFDGANIYFVPSRTKRLVRFTARSPTALPPRSSASFL